jgi:hypothetical protein
MEDKERANLLSNRIIEAAIEVHKALGPGLLVEDLIVVELKAIERIELIHEAQLTTYLRLTGLWLGLLLNFNVPVLRHGIKRIVLG